MLVAAAVALAGCQTTPQVTSKDYDKNNASAVNIGSLSTVIAQSPGDANAYNVRGTAYGKAGKLARKKAQREGLIAGGTAAKR